MAHRAAHVDALRAAIDALDHMLIDLCVQRLVIVRELLDVKRARGLPLLDQAREAELLAERSAFARERGVPPELVDTLMRALLDASHTEIKQRSASANEP